MKTKRLITLIEPKTLQAVNAAAKQGKVSQAEIVRRAIREFLERK